MARVHNHYNACARGWLTFTPGATLPAGAVLRLRAPGKAFQYRRLDVLAKGHIGVIPWLSGMAFLLAFSSRARAFSPC